MILGGAVSVGGSVVVRPSMTVAADADIEVRRPEDELASRGGEKLKAALEAFDIEVAGKVAVDVGASSGGFTDVLLRQGATRVYAIDVGYGQLIWRLRSDPRVVVMERTNFRTIESLPEAARVATVDVSFISLSLILPVLARVVDQNCETVALIKPQFEAGKDRVGKGGVVRDPEVHRSVLVSVLDSAEASGWHPAGLIASPLLGPAGNREFLAHLRQSLQSVERDELIDAALG